MAKTFIDTNILVYAMDMHDPKRRKQSRAALTQLDAEGGAVISTQVLQELYVVATKKLGVEPLTAKEILRGLEHFEIVTISPALIRDAIDCHILHRLSFWDALILTSAESARCDTLWSEDLSTGQVIRGVQVVNPLAA